MKRVEFDKIKILTIDGKNFLEIEDKKHPIDEVQISYTEKALFAKLSIKIGEEILQTRKLKSFWEHLRISTYDIMEKREDNEVFNIYCAIKDLQIQ
jgi:hypothetical protein